MGVLVNCTKLSRLLELFGGRAPDQYSIRGSLANVNRGARPKKRDHPKTAGEGTKKVETKAEDTKKTKKNGTRPQVNPRSKPL